MISHPFSRWFSLISLIIIFDQLSKMTIVAAFNYGDVQTVTSFFNWVRAHNSGAAFSFLANQSGWQNYFFITLGSVACGFMFWLLLRHVSETFFACALALIVGGAVGNLIDRVRFGYVIDFLDFHLGAWHWPAFNIADSAICVGAVMLVWHELRHKKTAHAD